ncbi:MAG: phospho-N-acetylmuramoyl-pentapeptide-transferase [Planctomycetaceae bacterium]|nr:phospho-N-acetylmuramoyl-pentapeptide-transferase [Planctomycetaceae bacterium]
MPLPEFTLTVRSAAAAATACGVVLLAGNTTVEFLAKNLRERVVSDSVELNRRHAAKQGTPTMGGLLIVFALTISCLIWADLKSAPVRIGLPATLAMMFLGAADDFSKAKLQKKGVSGKLRLIIEAVCAIVCGIAIAEHSSISMPSAWAEIAWIAFVLVGSMNAVNLTDGLDGLAAGCSVVSATVLAIICLSCANAARISPEICRLGPQSAEFSIVSASLAGAMLGFLQFNRHPARLFMGDTGALPAGFILGFAAIVSGREFLYAFVGGVFVLETVSVIAQVAWYKKTRNRLLLCSPLHNHFVFRGVAERKIVGSFWILALVLGLTGLAMR